MDVVKSLGLEKKFSPYNNPDIAWVYVFFPALIFYFSILMNNLNTKPNIGSIEIYDPSFQKLLYSNSKMEVISKGSSWAEGVLWIETDDLSYLLYSDTIQNRIFKWEEGKGFFTVGKTIHIDKSGCRTNISHCENTYEPGTNGLIRMLTQHYPKNIPQGIDIVACQHGERAITFLRQNGTRSFLATQYKGRKFNSPNDLIWSPEGHLYFTDPPYGLYTKHPKKIANREIPFHGIYMIPADAVKESFSSGTPTSNVKLLNKEFSRPNGLAFSPDYTQLYVSNSDATNAIWKVFEVSDTGRIYSQTL
jgi:gluconolactonase